MSRLHRIRNMWIVLLVVLPLLVLPSKAQDGFSVEVRADRGWVNTGIVLGIGQGFRLSAEGETGTQCDEQGCSSVSISGPDGQATTCDDLGGDCLLNGAPYGALVGRVGAGEPFYIGSGGVFSADTIGVLLLGVNDNTVYFDDNAGEYVAEIVGAVAAEQPEQVVIPGTFQSDLGCAEDWDPDCDETALAFDEDFGAWFGVFELPAGEHEFKVALNGSWDENYGGWSDRDGPNVLLPLSDDLPVLFTYNHLTHDLGWLVNVVVVSVPGSFQDEIGCDEDWQAHCALSQLFDEDADGIYEWTAKDIPEGEYEVKVAVNGTWQINYGEDGLRDGANISFTVEDGETVNFGFSVYDDSLTIDVR